MNARRLRARIGATCVVCAVPVLLVPAPTVAASTGDVEVVNTETVQVYTDAAGEVQSRRVYEQLSMTGQGDVVLTNPIETSGLRNLDEFGGFEVAGDNQVLRTSVDGEERVRTVSDYDGDLPLEVEVTYLLDGEEVSPGDVVGESGELEVRYLVRNTTAAAQQVTFDDGRGGTTTETVQVPVPMVGSLSTVAPPSFTDVRSEQANLAGDGKGGTKLSFTMTLFPPLGSDTAEFGYTATITDGVVPRADISALPISPLESPTFQTAASSYRSGAETGIQLADGATTIDENLLKLRDGAGDLLAGLLQLRDGAEELRAGLAGEAAPGAQRLAEGANRLDNGMTRLEDGVGDLSAGSRDLRDGAQQVAGGAAEVADGAGRLDSGARDLRDGAGRLADGVGDASSGGQDLAGGLALISDGLDQLASAQGLPKAEAGIQELQDGVDALVAGVGTTGDATTLLGGLVALEAGLTTARDGSTTLHGGLVQLAGTNGVGIDDARDGTSQVKAGLEQALADGGSLDQLDGGLATLDSVFCPLTAGVTLPNGTTCGQLVGGLRAGVTGSRTDLQQAVGGLGQVEGGLNNALSALDDQLVPGADQLRLGLVDATDGATRLKGGATELRAGLLQVDGGLEQLATGVTAAVQGVLELQAGADAARDGADRLAAGLLQLDGGAAQLRDGSSELAAGTGDLAAGSTDLADGAGRLSAGTGDLVAGTGDLAAGADELKDGSGQLADGAGDLAGGLGAAADGSGRLADGLDEAADGAPALVDGAQRLSDEGTSQLVDAGVETAQNYGRLYATIEAGSDRAETDAMAYGAPEGATGLTAYSYVVEGEDGEGGRNLTRGLLGLGLLGAAGGGMLLRRRLG